MNSSGSSSGGFGTTRQLVDPPRGGWRDRLEEQRAIGGRNETSNTDRHPTERVLIEESDIDGYTVTIQPRKRVRGQTRKIVTAEDVDALKSKDIVAHQWVERYHLPGGKDGRMPWTVRAMEREEPNEATRMLESQL